MKTSPCASPLRNRITDRAGLLVLAFLDPWLLYSLATRCTPEARAAVAPASEVDVTLEPVVFPPLQEAYAPMVPGEHVGLAAGTSAAVTFDRGGTLARVTCAPGERVDFVLPRGAALLVAGTDGKEPPVSFGDGSGVFVSVAPRRVEAGHAWEPAHPTQRHALLSCPAQKAVYGVRLLVREGEDGPKVTGGPLPVGGAQELHVRRTDAFTWTTFARAKPEAPLTLTVRPGARYVVRSRAVFSRDRLTTGYTRYQIVAGGVRVDLSSSLDTGATGVTLDDGAVPGTSSELVLSAGRAAPAGKGNAARSAGAASSAGGKERVAVALSCSQECLLRVEEIVEDRGTEARLAIARERAALDTGLSLRTLPPRGESGLLDMRSVVARVSEPMVEGDGMALTGGFVGLPPAVEAVRGADAFVRGRDGAAPLSFDVPRLQVSHLRLTLHWSASGQGVAGDAVYGIETVDGRGKSRRATLIANRALALPETARRGVSEAFDTTDVAAVEVAASGASDAALEGSEAPPPSGGSFARFESRVVLPVESDADRVVLTPLSEASRSAGRPFVSLSVGTRAAAARPVSFIEAANARLTAMKGHFASGGSGGSAGDASKDARGTSAGSRAAAAELRGAPSAVKELRTLEDALAKADSASDAAPILARREALVRSLAAGTLARSLAWETYFNHPSAAVACASARALAESSLAQEDTRTSALASIAAWRKCGVMGDMRTARAALLRGGALSSAQELEALLETPAPERVATLAQAAALRGSSPRARQVLLAHPAFAAAPHLHLPVDDALREAQGFLVNLNKETGAEETRVLSTSAAPARWSLEKGGVYLVSWRRVFDPSAQADGWLVVSGPGFEEKLPLGACVRPDPALEGDLCAADSDVVALPAGTGATEVTVRPLGGRVAVTVRERVASGGKTASLSEVETAVAAFRRLLARKETASRSEAARLVDEGDSVYRASSHRDVIAPLHGRLARGRAWTPVGENVLHAGLWKEDASTSAWPVAPEEAVPLAYARGRGEGGAAGAGIARAYRLYASRRLAFRSDRAGTLTLRLSASSEVLLPLEEQRVRVSREGRPERVVVLGGGRRSVDVPVSARGAGEVIALELLDDVAGQGVFLSLPGAGPEWSMPDERTWFVATPGQPVRAYLQGPGRARVEERDPKNGTVAVRYLDLEEGWKPVTIKPSADAPRAQIRLFQLRESSEFLVPRPRAEPFVQGSLALLEPASARLGAAALLPQAGDRGPARLAAGESHAASWRVFSEAESRSTVDDGDTSEGQGRLAGTLGVRRKQVFEGWGLFSSSSAQGMGVRDRQPLASLSQKLSFAPTPRFFRYSFFAEGVFQRPGGSNGDTEWAALTRHELAFPLAFSQGMQLTPRMTFFYRWQSLERVAERAKYGVGEIDTLIDNPWYRANPYGLGVGARFIVAPSAAIAGRLVLDAESVSGADVNPMDPMRLWGEAKWVQLVSDFDLEGFVRIERLDSSRDALLRTRGIRVNEKAGVGATYTYHSRGSRLLEAGARGGQDFEKGAPFGELGVVYHVTPDALLRHDAPDELLMREERLRRMGGGNVANLLAVPPTAAVAGNAPSQPQGGTE